MFRFYALAESSTLRSVQNPYVCAAKLPILVFFGRTLKIYFSFLCRYLAKMQIKLHSGLDPCLCLGQPGAQKVKSSVLAFLLKEPVASGKSQVRTSIFCRSSFEHFTWARAHRPYTYMKLGIGGSPFCFCSQLAILFLSDTISGTSIKGYRQGTSKYL